YLLKDYLALCKFVPDGAIAVFHDRFEDRRPKRKPKLVSRYQGQNGERRPPKRKWIARSRWHFVNREEHGQGIELVRQTHRHRHRRGRDFVALADGLVVVADGVGDFVGQALGASVVAAHKSLKFGKFSDHFGHEVGLTKPSCCLSIVE